jgi:mono/diheme cytochrome c family protein
MRINPPLAAAIPALALALALSSQSLAQDSLPEGPGKAAVQESCTQCHDIGTAIGQKRTPDEWADILDRMGGFGLTLSDAKRTEIQDYLNANLGSAPASPAQPPSGGAPTPKKP